ncbi:MAG: tetratricopeptide repeat protein [bacterium]
MGREKEAAEVSRQLLHSDVRLLTLVGAPGVGKTRLAIEVATGLRPRFPDGVFFVDLAVIREPAQVVDAIARTLDIQHAPGQPLLGRVGRFLRNKHLLIVLDNFEHVVAAASQIAELLEAAAHLWILATSRTPLHLEWERQFPVVPLSLPDLAHLPPPDALLDSPAVTLFVDRVQTAKPDFRLESQNARAVAEICVRLDGLPLALELAAARVSLLPPHALLLRLQSRLGLLTTGARDLPARHQTLRDALAWSHDLLDAQERVLFRRLGAFVGGCTLEELEALCNGRSGTPPDLIDTLGSLLDKHLTWQETQPDQQPRYRMLETIREYALDQLAASGELDSVRQRHAEVFLALAEQAEPALRGREVQTWLDRLDREHANIRAALEWAIGAGEIELALRTGGALWLFWFIRRYQREGDGFLQRALAVGVHVSPPVRAKALYTAAAMAWMIGNFARMKALSEESLAAFQQLNDRWGVAISIHHLAVVEISQGKAEQAVAMYERTLDFAREVGDDWLTAILLSNLAVCVATARTEDLQHAIRLNEESLGLHRTLGDRWGMSVALARIGGLERYRGNWERARRCLTEALDLAREMRDRNFISSLLSGLAVAAAHDHDYHRAATLLDEALAIAEELDDPGIVAKCLRTYAEIARDLSQWEQATRLYAAADALRPVGAGLVPRYVLADYERRVATLRSRLSAESFTRVWAEGRGMSMPLAAEYARAQTGIALPKVGAVPKWTSEKGRLSSREQEVAELVAQGLSNRDIAQRLVITKKTADHHVEHILDKLGFQSRAQIAAWVVTRKLPRPAL